jgi:SAM-dependent methyltransferase
MTGFPSDLYVGTAEYYERFRPRYPGVMLAELVESVGSGGLLVDIACGTGQIAVPLARSFGRVVAVDLEPEMIGVGRRVAERAGINNVDWRVARAEDLTIDAGTVDMVTIGNAFHRLDRGRIAGRAKPWLRPRGVLVVMGTGDPPDEPRPKAPWQQALANVVKRWTGPPSEAVMRAQSGPPHGEVLQSAGFEIERREWTEPHRWTLDELVGLMFSISITSKQQLGDRVDAFEADVRSSLLDLDATGTYEEELRFFAITATNPRDGEVTGVSQTL